jgi:rfaE bifunctional protein kinase chain/domain
MNEGGAGSLAAWVPKLAGVRVLVLGDLILDRYVLSAPARLSREAPVMIARYEGETLIPGGAANAALNVAALGGRASVIGVVGDDADGEALLSALQSRGVAADFVVRAAGLRTVAKTRYMVGEPHRMKQQVLRIDNEPEAPPADPAVAKAAEILERRCAEFDAVLVSDYGYEFVRGPLLAALASTRGPKILTADSRYLIGSFRGVTLATPNEGEAEEAAGFRFRNDEDVDRAGTLLRERLAAPALLITRGNRGMALFQPGRPRCDIPAVGSGQVVDVSGAGDTVIAVATSALAAGADFVDAARLANFAAGVVVSKWGAATCSPKELSDAIAQYG